MDLQMISEKENPLFKRKEILASLDYHGGSTPSKADLQKILAEQFKVAIDSVEITKILSENGLTKGRVWIKVWHEKKVPIYAELKKEKRGTEEEPREAPKEVPKEEKKE